MELVQNKQKHGKKTREKERHKRGRELNKGDFRFLNVSYFHFRI